MAKIEVRAAKLAEALAVTIPFAGTDPVLPSLNAVRFMAPRGANLVLAATNRFVIGEFTLHADDVPSIDGLADDGFTLALPAAKDWLKLAKAAARTNSGLGTVLLIEVDGELVTLAEPGAASSTSRTVGDQWVPNHERLWPTMPGELDRIGFRSDVIGAFAKAFKVEPLEFRFGENAKRPVAVTAPGVPEFRGLIMPVSLSE
jgi:hypothetical protein